LPERIQRWGTPDASTRRRPCRYLVRPECHHLPSPVRLRQREDLAERLNRHTPAASRENSRICTALTLVPGHPAGQERQEVLLMLLGRLVLPGQLLS
jgi:hypothetical protein